MSEPIVEEPKTEEVPPIEEKTLEPVSAEHHKTVRADMMKYKQERAELREQLAIIKADTEAEKVKSLEANQEWEKIAKLKDGQLQELQKEQLNAKEGMINSHKKAAVIQKIGGFVKSSYADFAINLENIAMIDGIIDEATLDAECERLRRDEGALLKQTFTANLPNGAPNKNAGESTKDYSTLTQTQKEEMRRQAVQARINNN